MDRLQTMRVFQTVADEAGFSAAARRLDMSVPTVTRLVADLEQHLGTRLLQRTTRSVSLTGAGEAYLERVRAILADVEDAFSLAQSHTQELSGSVRVLTPPVFAEHVLGSLAADFRQRYPQVSIEVFVESASEAAVGEYDITFLSAEEGYDANVVARPIISTCGLACAAPEYLAAHGIPAMPQDLQGHQCLLRRRVQGRSDLLRLRRIDGSADEVEISVQPVLVANHTGTLLRATLAGAGISTQPLNLIAPHLRSGRLRHVLPEWTTGRFTIYATLPTRKFMPARVRAFLDFVAEYTQRSMQGLPKAPPSAQPA